MAATLSKKNMMNKTFTLSIHIAYEQLFGGLLLDIITVTSEKPTTNFASVYVVETDKTDKLATTISVRTEKMATTILSVLAVRKIILGIRSKFIKINSKRQLNMDSSAYINIPIDESEGTFLYIAIHLLQMNTGSYYYLMCRDIQESLIQKGIVDGTISATYKRLA